MDMMIIFMMAETLQSGGNEVSVKPISFLSNLLAHLGSSGGSVGIRCVMYKSRNVAGRFRLNCHRRSVTADAYRRIEVRDGRPAM